MTNTVKQQYRLEDNRLIVTTDYGDLAITLSGDFNPGTMCFASGNNNHIIQKYIGNINAINRDSLELRFYGLDMNTEFTVNRVIYHNLTGNIRIREGKIDHFWCKAWSGNSYSNSLTDSAHKKIKTNLEKLFIPLLDEKLDHLIEVCKTTYHLMLQDKLEQYQKHISETLKYYQDNCAISTIKLLKQKLKKAIDYSQVNQTWLDELLVSSINESSIYEEVKRIAEKYNNQSKNVLLLEDKFKSLAGKAVKSYIKQYCPGTKTSEFCNGDSFKALAYELLNYYTEDSQELFFD